MANFAACSWHDWERCKKTFLVVGYGQSYVLRCNLRRDTVHEHKFYGPDDTIFYLD